MTTLKMPWDDLAIADLQKHGPDSPPDGELDRFLLWFKITCALEWPFLVLSNGLTKCQIESVKDCFHIAVEFGAEQISKSGFPPEVVNENVAELSRLRAAHGHMQQELATLRSREMCLDDIAECTEKIQQLTEQLTKSIERELRIEQELATVRGETAKLKKLLRSAREISEDRRTRMEAKNQEVGWLRQSNAELVGVIECIRSDLMVIEECGSSAMPHQTIAQIDAVLAKHAGPTQ